MASCRRALSMLWKVGYIFYLKTCQLSRIMLNIILDLPLPWLGWIPSLHMNRVFETMIKMHFMAISWRSFLPSVYVDVWSFLKQCQIIKKPFSRCLFHWHKKLEGHFKKNTGQLRQNASQGSIIDQNQYIFKYIASIEHA